MRHDERYAWEKGGAVLLVLFSVLFGCSCESAASQKAQAERNLALLEENTADSDFTKGRSLVLEEKFGEALPYLEKSGEPEALFFRALALQGLGRKDEAVALFALCVQNGIQVAESLYNIGLVAYESGDRESAIARMNEVLAKEPGHAGAHYFLASAAYEKNDMATAETHFRAAVKSMPQNGAAWEGLFYALVSQNKFSDAWETREHLDLAAGDNLANLLLVGEKIGKPAEALALIPAGEIPPAAKLRRVVLVAQTIGLAAAIAEAVKLPSDLTVDTGYVVLDRGTDGSLEWGVSRIVTGGMVTLTCFTDPNAKPTTFTLSVSDTGVAVNKKSYPFDRFRAAIPDICRGK